MTVDRMSYLDTEGDRMKPGDRVTARALTKAAKSSMRTLTPKQISELVAGTRVCWYVTIAWDNGQTGMQHHNDAAKSVTRVTDTDKQGS